MHPKIAVETPIRNLDLGCRYSDYLFVLAHLWTNDKYRKTILKWGRRKKIYLDNSAFELQRSIDFDPYFDIITELRPHVIVVPDVVGDLRASVDLACRFFEQAPGHLFSRHKFMVVLQGQNNRERLRCLHIYKSMGLPFHIIGLPRHAYPHRVELLLAIYRSQKNSQIHFLGLPDIKELRGVSALIDSLDTSWPSRMALGKSSIDFFGDNIENPLAFKRSLSQLRRITMESE
ncbi:MAG: hypothetical protein QXT73_02230 [Candidatus Methanomethylicaceae archaeon]